MKSYPSIPGTYDLSNNFYVFDKLDGTNIRAEWSRKRGFYKFGTRKCMIDELNPQWGKSVELIKILNDTIGKNLNNSIKSIVGFFEFHGPSSFAGQHNPNEKMKVTLFDVAIDKKGILEPREFLKYFDHIETPKLLYNGKIGKDLIDQVKENKLKGITFEGVVCKSITYKSPGLPFMWKIKTNQWLDKLKEFCKGNEKLFEELR